MNILSYRINMRSATDAEPHRGVESCLFTKLADNRLPQLHVHSADIIFTVGMKTLVKWTVCWFVCKTFHIIDNYHTDTAAGSTDFYNA